MTSNIFDVIYRNFYFHANKYKNVGGQKRKSFIIEYMNAQVDIHRSRRYSYELLHHVLNNVLMIKVPNV